MKMFKASLLVLIPLLLSSCGNRPRGLVLISQNGSLYDIQEPTATSELSDYVRHTDSPEILSYLQNDEPFVLYVGMAGCLGCNMFKPNLQRYVYETQALIHYLNVGDNDDYLEYSKIWTGYQDIFMADLEVPYLMIVESSEAYVKGAVSKMTATTDEPFINMMNSLVDVANVASHIQNDSATNYLASSEEGLFFFYDREDEDALEIYRTLIWPYAAKSERSLQVVDYTNFTEEELIILRATFSLGEDIGPIAKYYEGEAMIEAHYFGIDEASDRQFLEAYL